VVIYSNFLSFSIDYFGTLLQIAIPLITHQDRINHLPTKPYHLY